MELEIVCENDKYLPKYQNSSDACMDLKVRIPEGTYKIKPYTISDILGTGIKVKIPDGYVMLIFPRSSTGMKLHCIISNTTGVIDSGYRDEVKIQLYNFGDTTVKLVDGQRVAQFMIIPRPYINLVKITDDVNFRDGDRGGGIGSTGK